MQTEETPDYSGGSDDSNDRSSDRTSIGDRPQGAVGEERQDNRHFRGGGRQRHRDCYCRGRNKNCPKCGGTGQLLPNWRENLNNARQNSPRPSSLPTPNATGFPSAPASSSPVSSTPVGAPRDTPRDIPRDTPRDTAYAPSSFNSPSTDRYSSGEGSGGGYRSDRDNRDRNDRGDRGDRDRGDRGSRRDRWDKRDRNRGGSGGSGRQGGGNQKPVIKMCPMCGEYTNNLRQHILARHDD